MLQKNYGLVGVKSEGGTNYIVMVSAGSRSPTEVERVPLLQTNVFLKAECDFKNRADKAHRGSAVLPLFNKVMVDEGVLQDAELDILCHGKAMGKLQIKFLWCAGAAPAAAG